MEFPDSMTLGEARDQLRLIVTGGAKGHVCPCCQRNAKIYKRTIHQTMARVLIQLRHVAEPGTFLEIRNPKVSPLGATTRGFDVVRTQYWGLMVDEGTRREDGGRAGYWCITPKGVAFVDEELRLPKIVSTYGGRVLGFTGPEVGIRECLGKRYNYDEEMGRV